LRVCVSTDTTRQCTVYWPGASDLSGTYLLRIASVDAQPAGVDASSGRISDLR
jgi:hypothetical protein